MDTKALSDQVGEIVQRAGSPKAITPHSLVQLIMATMNSTMMPLVSQINVRLANLEGRAKIFEEKFAIIEQQKEDLGRLQVECKSLKEENDILKKNLKRVTRLALENKRHSFQYNLLLHGVSEEHPTLGGTSDVRDPKFRDALVSELRLFDATITGNDFEMAHRLGPPKPVTVGDPTVPPRAILIKFYNRNLKQKLLEESIRRYKTQKDSADATSRRPYLTTHRVREVFSEDEQQEDTEPHKKAAAPQERTLRKRGGNLKSPLQGAAIRRRRVP